MPKKLVISFDDLKEAILRINASDYFDDKNRLHPRSHDIWNLLSSSLNHKMNSKYLHTYVKANRGNILQAIRDSLVKNNENLNCVNYECSQLDKDFHSNTDSQSDNDFNTIKFNITLSSKEWDLICPKSVVYYNNSYRMNSGRTYTVLQPGQWTPLINEHVYEQIKINCKMVYKRAKIYKDGTFYLVMDGSCSECNSTFKGLMDKKPHENSRAIINCTYSGNFETCLGGGKRKLIGSARSKALNQLVDLNQTASFIRRNEASRLMNFGDKEPSNLPSLNALRVLKSKAIKKEQEHDDSILSLSILKNDIPYSTIIRDIGYDRFFVHYWSTIQLNAYRQYAKQSKTPLISIDATGGVVRKPVLISGRKCNAIFLYEIALHNGQSQYPVAHMLSERHDNNSISHWLMQWTRDGAPSPKIVVTDQSIALMSACVRSFTQYSNLTTYLEVCSSLVLTPGKYSIPNCFIRNNIAHIMKLITSWNEFKGLTYRIKNFYLRAIGLIISCTNFNDAKKLLELIFIIALNETDGSNIVTGKANKCDVAKTYLKNRIANDEFMLDDIIQENDPDHIDKHVENIDEEIPDHFHSGYKSQMFKVISDIYNECVIEAKEKNDEGSHDNMHFNEPLAKKLKDFCKFIPIWSAVMVSIFKYGKTTESSAASESLFNDLKNRIFNHKTLPLRKDDFIKTHIKSVEGSIILSESRNISSTVHQIQPNNEDLIQPNYDTVNLCPACKNGDFPSDAHKCIICSANVHVLDECSVSIGNEEGYGEKRKCIGCHTSNTSNINAINEDLTLENWGNEALGQEKRRTTWIKILQ